MANNVNITAGSGTVIATEQDGSAPNEHYQLIKIVDGTVAGFTNRLKIASDGSITVALPTGASTAAKQPALGTAGTASADVLTVQGIASMTALKVDGSAVTQPVSQSGTFTVQPGNTANTTAWLVNNAPVTSGGLSTFHLVGAASTNATNVKASAGQVYSISAFNLNASPRYLKFHNTASTPTAGSGVVASYMIPGNSSGAGLVFSIAGGLAFSTGIGITITTGIGDSDTGAISASECIVNLGYK